MIDSFLDKLLRKIRIGKIVKYIAKKNGIICDVGCGAEPKFLLDLQDLISEGWGIDKETTTRTWNNKIQTIRRNLDGKISFPFNKNKFDYVTMLATLEHFKFPKEVLRESWRVLKPKGVLIITIPSPIAKPILEFLALLGVISREEIKDHHHYYPKKELISLLKEIGFDNIKHGYFELGFNQRIIAKK